MRGSKISFLKKKRFHRGIRNKKLGKVKKFRYGLPEDLVKGKKAQGGTWVKGLNIFNAVSRILQTTLVIRPD